MRQIVARIELFVQSAFSRSIRDDNVPWRPRVYVASATFPADYLPTQGRAGEGERPRRIGDVNQRNACILSGAWAAVKKLRSSAAGISLTGRGAGEYHGAS
jgi:hypothetical protein